MTPRLEMRMFCTVAAVLVAVGAVFSFFGLDILPVRKDALLPWMSAIYGAIMIGWGVTLFAVGRIAFRRDDPALMTAMLAGITVWLAAEAAFSLALGVWFNVGVAAAVLVLFAVPLVSALRRARAGVPA
jgi:hypothetical protein